MYVPNHHGGVLELKAVKIVIESVAHESPTFATFRANLPHRFPVAQKLLNPLLNLPLRSGIIQHIWPDSRTFIPNV